MPPISSPFLAVEPRELKTWETEVGTRWEIWIDEPCARIEFCAFLQILWGEVSSCSVFSTIFIIVYSPCCLCSCQLHTSQSHLGKGNLRWENAPTGLSCVCFLDWRERIQVTVSSAAGVVVLNLLRKQAEPWGASQEADPAWLLHQLPPPDFAPHSCPNFPSRWPV